MIRKYDKTHKTLSLIAATVLLTLGLNLILTALGQCFNGLLADIMWGRDFGGLLLNFLYLLIPVYFLSFSGIVVALILRKKSTLSGIAFGIPLVCTFLVSPLLCLGSGDVVDAVLQIIQVWGFLIPPALFCVAIMVTCFTKGRIFGEKAGIALLILGGLAWLTVATLPVTSTFTNSILMSIRYAEELSVGELLQDCLRGVYSIPSVLIPSSIFPLIGLAFFLPDKEPAEPAEESPEEEEVQE